MRGYLQAPCQLSAWPEHRWLMGFSPSKHFCSSWYFGFLGALRVTSSSASVLWGRLMTQVTTLSHCHPSIGSFPCLTSDLMTGIWQGLGPMEPTGLHVGFLAVAISGLSTELSLPLTIQSKGERRKKPGHLAFWKEEFHGHSLLFLDHYGIRGLGPGKSLRGLMPTPP